ncbi:MAG: YjbQ family protein [Deltaproteobacteria bacterium]|nr:YjbQ family protein [Deltaproteobacteria bacterium]
MEIFNHTFTFSTTGDTDVLDLTPEVYQKLAKSGITSGMVNLFVPGSTAALTTIEYESGVVADLKQAIDRIAPQDIPYQHDRRWGDGNGYAHVRAALLGPSLHIPIIDGRMILGTWQQIVLLDFDNRPRRRQVLMQVMGQ